MNFDETRAIIFEIVPTVGHENNVPKLQKRCFAFIAAARNLEIHINHAVFRKSGIQIVRQFPVSIESFFNSANLSVLGNQLVERDEPS